MSLVGSSYFSRGSHKIEILSEEAIALDGVVSLFRDMNYENEMLRLGEHKRRARQAVLAHNKVWDSKEKMRRSQHDARSTCTPLPFPGALPAVR